MNTNIFNGHNFISERFEPRVAAVIGGKGAMGKRIAAELSRAGLEVRVTGAEPLREIGPTELPEWKRAVRRWNRNICKDADVVVFSVPIPLLSLEAGLDEIFGRTPLRGWRNKLVIDICSTKTGPVRALGGLKGATVIATHPMFGPALKSLVGQTVFVCPVKPAGNNRVLQERLKVRFDWLKTFWQNLGVKTVEIDPEKHDDFMPQVQFGVLLAILLYGDGLRNANASLDAVQHHGTPNSRALAARLARMIAVPMLATYTNVIFDNPNNLRWIDHTITILSQFRGWIAGGNRELVCNWMKEIADFLTPMFRDHFTKASVYQDECVAKQEFITACLANEAPIREYLARLSDSSGESRNLAA